MRVTRRVATVALVHLLLAVVALGAVAVWGFGYDPAAQHVTVPDPDTRLPSNPERLTIVRPPGLLVMDSTFVKHGALPTDALGEAEGSILLEAGVVKVKALVGREGELSQGVWQMWVRDGSDPRGALRAIDDLYATGGWAQEPTETAGLVVRAQKPNETQPFSGYRAHYVRGPFLIRIEAYGTDQAQVDDAFADLARRQLAAWPPR